MIVEWWNRRTSEKETLENVQKVECKGFNITVSNETGSRTEDAQLFQIIPAPPTHFDNGKTYGQKEERLKLITSRGAIACSGIVREDGVLRYFTVREDEGRYLDHKLYEVTSRHVVVWQVERADPKEEELRQKAREGKAKEAKLNRKEAKLNRKESELNRKESERKAKISEAESELRQKISEWKKAKESEWKAKESEWKAKERELKKRIRELEGKIEGEKLMKRKS